LAAFEGPGVVEFHASTQGLAVSGSSKGYVYAETPPSHART